MVYSRFGYDEEVFPNYSWEGYAVFSDIQREIISEIYIEKPSLYRMVLMYHNPGTRTIVGKIKITPDNPSDTEQVRFTVSFSFSIDVGIKKTSRTYSDYFVCVLMRNMCLLR